MSLTDEQVAATKALESLHLAACDGNVDHPGYAKDLICVSQFILSDQSAELTRLRSERDAFEGYLSEIAQHLDSDAIDAEAILFIIREREADAEKAQERAEDLRSLLRECGEALGPFSKTDWPSLADDAILQVQRFNVAPNFAEARHGFRVSHFRRAAALADKLGEV